ncbi:MAG: cysteine desulfurase family protein [Clostridia bacterium]
MENRIYLDNAATTPISGEVLAEMMPCLTGIYGNSSSIHEDGRQAQAIIDNARDKIAQAFNAKSNEIYFTGGGSEANNWAIKGVAYANSFKGKHIITSSIEHDSVLESCKTLENEGFDVTYLPVDSTGLISVAELMRNIRKDTILVSIMLVNNEVGTIQNIKALAKTAHEKNIIFHTDAVQAIGCLKIDVTNMDVDLMSASAHKIYGPKGTGMLYIKNGIQIQDLIDGGNQERGKRGGTSNVAGIAGFGKALEIAVRDMNVNNQKLKSLRTKFIKLVEEKIDMIKVNGHPFQKVQGIVSISFELIEGESILLMLDLAGISVSTGSACTSNSLKPSHVLTAMGISDEGAQGTIRFSFGKGIREDQIEIVVEELCKAVQKLRAISPLTKAGRKKNV